jgi:hypothetical protein
MSNPQTTAPLPQLARPIDKDKEIARLWHGQGLS